MQKSIQFETPENVVVSYEPAGLGTRFVAWVVDQIILNVTFFLITIILLIVGAAAGIVVEDVLGGFASGDGSGGELFSIAMGIVVVLGLGNFFYYGLSELFMRGQTIGKRLASIRVVRANGFQLDGFSILIRNVFRILDHLPPVWLVPFLAQRSQRLGDMVGGTVVVRDKPGSLADEAGLRQRLLAKSPAELTYRFDGSQLAKVNSDDFEAIERILARWQLIEPRERFRLASHVSVALAMRLNVPRPESAQHYYFLEDLLAAEYRRQYRQLG